MRQRTFEKKENRDVLLFENFTHMYYKDPNVLVFFWYFVNSFLCFYCYDCSLCAFLSATFFLNCDYRLLFE